MSPGSPPARSHFALEPLRCDGSIVLRVTGELDMSTAPLLERELRRAAAAQPRRLIVSLERVTFMDASGLRALTAFADAQSDGCRFAVTRGSGQVQRLFALSRVGSRLRVVAPAITPPRALARSAERQRPAPGCGQRGRRLGPPPRQRP
jgi:anti-sigma B factor antagonist